MEPKDTAFAYSHNMARALSVDDGVVELAFDPDAGRWPWLALPPQHPVVFEKYHYFGSVTAAWAAGFADPRTHGALTRSQFELPPLDDVAGHATRGTVRFRDEGEGKRSFELTLRDDAGQVIASSRGMGHNFTDRDFRAFRKAARQKVLDRHVPGQAFEPAAPEDVGLPDDGGALVSTLRRADDAASCSALVTRASGFHPAHPFHTGSGDHVNVAQMLDCGLQLCHQLLRPDAPLRCISGQSAFTRFVELDVPFELQAQQPPAHADGVDTVALVFSQLDRECARITLRFAR